ncbi:hypothetical protein KY336_02295 [Candidatus Woesearchaeota archaeon]|nr:hypothetical protein [Candidatus Woesearchaeota archaeon]
MADKPYEIVPSDESHRFQYPIVDGSEDPRKELSDKTETVQENSLTSLLKARDADNYSAWNAALYSTAASVLSLATNVIHNDALQKVDFYNLQEFSADFAERAGQILASPLTGIFSYCMMLLGAMLAFRAIGARMSARELDKKLLKLEKGFKENNKHYNRLISSGSNDL